jgi:MFS transporter, ACS family, allantoate permease
VVAACYFLSPFILLAIRYILAKENKKRDAEENDTTYVNVFVEKKHDDGTIELKRIDKVMYFEKNDLDEVDV